MNRQTTHSEKDLELNNNCKRAVRTSFIGALANFEKGFGYLWGHGKPKDEALTDNEKLFLQRWLQVRESVLDCGNTQCRIIDREFDKFIIKYNGFQYKFSIKPRSNNG